MRNFKIFLWIFIIFLIQTVILSGVHVFGAVPSLVMAYVVCVMLLENEFRSAVTISIICAVAMGALSGREFTGTVLLYVYCSIIVFSLRKKPRYVGNLPKAIVWTFLASGVMEIVYDVLRTLSVSTDMLLYDALPTAVFNAVLALIVYPILKATMYREEKKKKLLIA
ncbi:MAG: hypothetical protein ACI4A5_05825 [Hominilimicola sp.]